MFVNIIRKKFTSFCQVLKKMGTKENRFLFFLPHGVFGPHGPVGDVTLSVRGPAGSALFVTCFTDSRFIGGLG